MKASAEIILPAPLDQVWQHVLTPRLMVHVAAPWVAFRPLHPAAWPDQWQPGPYRVAMRLFGLVPLGEQTIGIEFPACDDPQQRRLRDNGWGALIRRWDHQIYAMAIDNQSCRYRDEVTISAGLLTPFIWVYAQLFYRHRQRRWRRLVAANFDYGAAR